MREIKFKAFLRCNQRLANGITLGYEKFPKGIYEVMDLNFANEIAALWSEKEQTSFEVSFRKIELMQYTGANDKRGVEIYEGDIVKFESSVPIPEDPDYPKEGQIGVIEYGFCDYYVNAKSPCRFNLNELGDWIVVGNIYENPEILKDR